MARTCNMNLLPHLHLHVTMYFVVKQTRIRGIAFGSDNQGLKNDNWRLFFCNI